MYHVKSTPVEEPEPEGYHLDPMPSSRILNEPLTNNTTATYIRQPTSAESAESAASAESAPSHEHLDPIITMCADSAVEIALEAIDVITPLATHTASTAWRHSLHTYVERGLARDEMGIARDPHCAWLWQVLYGMPPFWERGAALSVPGFFWSSAAHYLAVATALAQITVTSAQSKWQSLSQHGRPAAPAPAPVPLVEPLFRRLTLDVGHIAAAAVRRRCTGFAGSLPLDFGTQLGVAVQQNIVGCELVEMGIVLINISPAVVNNLAQPSSSTSSGPLAPLELVVRTCAQFQEDVEAVDDDEQQ